MSILFTPLSLGDLAIPNRFICSATYEGMALPTGEVTERLIDRYRNLAKGEAGLVIPGYFYVHAMGRAFPYQSGIHRDELLPGLIRLTEAVHQEGGRIVFQLAHAGRQTTKALIGKTPLGPSGVGRDPINLVKPKEMEAADIREVIKAFGVAAKRAHQAGADGIQLHAAHGYLINQFLSPFFNQRIDEWGGSEANRFRFLKEVLLEVKSVLPTGCPVLVKLNSRDYTPREGITPSLAATYAGWLADLGIQGLEVSCGSALYSFMNMCRGDVPVKEMAYSLPYWKRPIGTMMMKRLVGKYQLEEGYNLEAARLIKPVMGSIPLAVVGGWRTLAVMEETLERGPVDCISMSRPFIREPFIVKRFKEGKAEKVGCVSCNRCLAALVNNLPVQCYQKHFPLP